jgi:hypothetical protein
MFARGLAQALCFPVMYTALMELLSYEAGTPRIMMVPVETIMNAGRENIVFADIVRIVSRKFSGDICLGIFTSRNEIILAPQKTSRWTLKHGDRVIVVTRRMNPVEMHLSALAGVEDGVLEL